MKPAWVPLAEITLTSTDSEITFGSIPNTYRDLIVVFNGKISGDFDTPTNFNSDSSASYYMVNMRGDGSSTASSANTASTLFSLGLRNVIISSSDEIVSVIQIMDYSATDKHKTALKRVNSASKQTYAEAVRWANTSAITSIRFQVSGGTFSIGSTFALYGSNKL